MRGNYKADIRFRRKIDLGSSDFVKSHSSLTCFRMKQRIKTKPLFAVDQFFCDEEDPPNRREELRKEGTEGETKADPSLGLTTNISVYAARKNNFSFSFSFIYYYFFKIFQSYYMRRVTLSSSQKDKQNTKTQNHRTTKPHSNQTNIPK